MDRFDILWLLFSLWVTGSLRMNNQWGIRFLFSLDENVLKVLVSYEGCLLQN